MSWVKEMAMKITLPKFLRNEDGAVALEAIIVTPILASVFVGSFVFFDGFRTYNSAVKANYAISDVLSRAEVTMYGSDIEGLSDVFQHITRSPEVTQLRATQVRREQAGFVVVWSYGTQGRLGLTNATLGAITEYIPMMDVGSHILVVETFLPYTPAFNVGMGEIEFDFVSATRPRFTDRVDFNDGTHPSYCIANCDLGEDFNVDDAGPDQSGFDWSTVFEYDFLEETPPTGEADPNDQPEGFDPLDAI